MAKNQLQDENFCERVIQRSQPRLVEDLDPIAVLDLLLEKEYITYPQFRDIQELRLTSEKTREILKRISLNGVEGYETFKQLLAKSKQQALVKYLKEQEGILKKELEGQKQKRQMASANKRGKMQPPVHQIAAELANVPKEKDLLKIAEAIGRNWEMLAPYLITKNPTATVEQIQMDRPNTRMRIYELLIKWKQEAADKATFGELFHQMLQVGTSVTIEWGDIAKSLKIAEKDIRACKEGYVSTVSAGGQPVQQANDRNKEKIEVVTARTGVQVQGILTQTETDGPSLMSKQSNKSYRPPKDACVFDGRLLKLEKKDIDILRKCEILIGTGGFGKVYKSDTVLEGFGISVAVKKISLGKSIVKDRSVRREKLASRMMHQFILPLLAVVEHSSEGKTKVWFVSPLCEEKDLYFAIQHDAKPENTDIKMKHVTRLKILLQIALAIQYIHTEVPGVRKQILHKDISSKNVVLDANFNARLIDFGLAREKDDLTTNIQGNSHYRHPKVGTGVGATESWDYYAFGVVIREMLTGLGPEGRANTYLSYFSSGEIIDNLQENVWLKVDPVLTRSEELNTIAEHCIDEKNVHWNVSSFEENVVKNLNGLWNECNQSELFSIKDGDEKRCHICKINPRAIESSMKKTHEAFCTQKIEVCTACEKNSFLNPVTCYCGAKLEPNIGSKWGALLVAGNDLEKTSLAEALTKDLTELKKLITSKAPRIMGIRDEKVHIVVPGEAGKPKDGGEPEKLWPKVKEKIKLFSKEKDVDTLLIYFSCHGAKGNGTGDQDGKNRFELASVSDSITLEDFQKELEGLKNIDRLIIFLDRCFPPLLNLERMKNVIQINACKDDQQADFNDDGSTFTKYLIQGLKAKSEKTCSDDCKHCDEYWDKRTDFISAQSLFDYVEGHMRGKAARPIWQQKCDCKNIAYYTDEVVEIEFKSKDDGTKHVTLEYLKDMDQLKTKLRQQFGKAENVKVDLQKDTYRKDDPFINCDTLEKVMSAWVHRQPLHVKFG